MAKLTIEIDDASALLAANRRVWNGMGDPVEFLQSGIAEKLLADAKAQAIRNAETDVTAAVTKAKDDAAAAFEAAVAVSVGGVAVEIGASGKLEPVKP